MRWIKILNGLLMVGMICALVGTSLPAAAQVPQPEVEEDAAPLNTIHGVVRMDDGNAPQLAQVAAWKDRVHYKAPVGVDGSYSLNVGAGDWWVTVVPLAAGAVSPNWVYTGDAQLVRFEANPDPVTPSLGVDFTVTLASGVIHGSLLAPDGTTLFSAPNQVWVRAQNQEGQGNTVLADPLSGAFNLNVLPGNTLIKLVFENPLWAPPLTLAGSEWYVEDKKDVDTGELALLEKKARISGVVTDEASNPVEGLAVRAWRVDGALTAKVKTGADGSYALPVLAGVWEVQVVPGTASPFVAAQSPVRVRLPLETSSEVVNLGVLNADVTVTGTVVDKNGAFVPGLNGHIYALYPQDDRWPQFGTGAAIINSVFTLKLSSGLSDYYKLKSSFATTAGYTAISAIHLSVQPGDSLTVTLPVAANNSTISGYFIDYASNQPKTGLPGTVYGASNSGAVKRDLVNPLDGSYLIQTAAVDTSGFGGSFWWLKGYVDPTTGWTVLQPRTHKVFLPYNEGDGADVESDFYVAQVNSIVRGTVKDADGNLAAGVRVTVADYGGEGGSRFIRWTETNADGFFRIPVPAGRYKVTADFRNWIAPLPAVVNVLAKSVINVTLAFRAKDATISGVVTLDDVPHSAFIRAYSNSGAHVVGAAGLDGVYTLEVNSGDMWHVQAASEADGEFLQSERDPVLTKPGENTGNDLKLHHAEQLPDAVILTFDASQSQTLTLSNGSQVVVPAGALALSGEVSISARPLMELSDNGGARPVSFGYRLHAFDANLNPIDHFNSPLTLVMPFTAKQLADLGVRPDQLVPNYWDQSSASWKPVPNFSLTVLEDGSGSLNLAVNHFTDYALLSDVLPITTYLPVMSNGE